MSHIVKFSVAGLAGRTKPYSQQLDRHINIFFGLNGAGKTSLLKILHSAMEGKAESLEHVPFHTAEVTIYSIEYDREFTRILSKGAASMGRTIIPGAVTSDLVPSAIRRPTKLHWKYKGGSPPTKSVGWRETYLPTWRLQPQETIASEYGFEQRFHPAQVDWDVFFANSLDSIWKGYSNELLAKLQKIQAEGLVSILRSIMRPTRAKRKAASLDANIAFSRVKAFLDRQGAKGILRSREKFDKQYRRDSHLQKVVDDINDIEQRVERSRSSRDSLQQLITALFIGPKRVTFEDTRIWVEGADGAEIGIASLSSGEKQMLRLLIQSLLAEESSLLIDEPEISLHIDWQRRLISAMRLLNPNCQLILATHSPEIMAEISDENIFRL